MPSRAGAACRLVRQQRSSFTRIAGPLIDRLVCSDRTAVSSALLAIAGIGAGTAARRAVLARVSEAACWAQAEGAISPTRAAEVARHVKRALNRPDERLAA